MAKVSIRGVIVSNDDKWIYEWFEMDATSPKDVFESIEKANGEDLEVEINSGGGDVYAGSEIYTLLKEYNGNVTTKILGVAASAASVIAMAGDKVLISPTAQIMIHNVWSTASGDYRDLQHESDVLKNYNKTIANAYRIKSGLEESKLLEMMDKETWLTAQDALEYGFVDEVMFENGSSFAASINQSVLLPKQVINKIRNELIKKPTNQEDEPQRDKSDFLMAKLNLLKLRKGDIDD